MLLGGLSSTDEESLVGGVFHRAMNAFSVRQFLYPLMAVGLFLLAAVNVSS